MTSRYGVFTEAEHIADPYPTAVQTDQRDHGLNFKAPVCKTGKAAAFDALKPLYAGEPFVEALRSAVQARNASRKHNVSDKAWKAASPMKRSACPGDFVGTLGGPVPYVAGTVDVRKKKGEVQGTPKNIVTAPCKRGGFGFNKTTLSERHGAAGVAGEYAYVADPVHQAVRQPVSPDAAPAPFRPVSPPKRGGPGTVSRNFGGRAKGAVGEFEWRPRPGGPRGDQAGAAAAAAAAGGGAVAASTHAGGPAFRPASLPHKGAMATFDKYPEHLHDPEAAKAAARAAARAREREAVAAHAGGAWRPGGGVKSDATRWIMRMNL